MATEKDYIVDIPIVGYLSYTVQVDVEGKTRKEIFAEAMEKAWEIYNESSKKEIDNATIELNAVEAVVEGNVFHGPCSKIHVEEAR